MASITEHEDQEIREANASGRPPVVFVHGLWLLPSSWDRWETLFQEAGNSGVTEIQKIPGRGHALTIDSGWREVAQIALAFVERFVPPRGAAAVRIEGGVEGEHDRTPVQETADSQ